MMVAVFLRETFATTAVNLFETALQLANCSPFWF
jgi:hypothetical protein